MKKLKFKCFNNSLKILNEWIKINKLYIMFKKIQINIL